jgi:hypothetical protein
MAKTPNLATLFGTKENTKAKKTSHLHMRTKYSDGSFRLKA